MLPLAPETIDISALPFVNLKDVKSLPKTAGIYFVFSETISGVIYIGVSSCIYRRLFNHHRKQTFTTFPQLRIAWMLVPYEYLASFEARCIAFFNPLLNSARGGRLGARPRGYISTHVMLPPDLIEWAKEQPEGLSGIARQAMSQEQKRRKVSA